MCRIMAIGGIKPHVSKKKLWDFMFRATPLMLQGNNDGLGYAAMGKEGIWGERWFDTDQAWKEDSRKAYTQKDEEVNKKFKGALETDLKYNRFGVMQPATTTAVIFHSRAATTPKTLENVHPFVRDDVALIHNGVIRNHEMLKKVYSTCDSEVILNEYVDEDVANKPEMISEVTQAINGSYGCAVLSIDKDKKRHLDIFRETSSVYACYVDELETTVFCTSPEIIRETCKALKWTYRHMFKLKERVFIRMDCETGTPILQKDFQVWSYKSNWENNSSSGGTADAGKHQSEMKQNSTDNGQKDTESEKKSALVLVPTQEELEKLRAAQ